MSYMPLAFITARTGKNVKALLNLAQALFKQANRRVGTGTLNRVLREAVAAHPPASREGRAPRIYYATQVGSAPPTIVLFVNSTRLFDATYQRYLLNVFRDKLPFRDVPIKLYLRSRTQTSLEERKAGRGRAEGDSGDDWIDSDDDFEGGRSAPGSSDDVEDVRYINLEVNELLSDLDS
jgi:GTP-binding protein